MLKIGGVIAALLVVGAIAFPQFRPAIISLAPFALFALCPLSMFFAMRGMKEKGHTGSMVKIITQQDKELHQCGECGLQYADKAWAEKCEAWCKEHHTCNVEVIAHAIQTEEQEQHDS